jgi:hypothetical protein
LAFLSVSGIISRKLISMRRGTVLSVERRLAFPFLHTPMFNKENLYQIYPKFQVVSLYLWQNVHKYYHRIQNCGIQQPHEHFDIPFCHFFLTRRYV